MWSQEANMRLVLEYQKYIDNPHEYPLNMIKIVGKSPQAVQRHLKNIHNSNDAILKRHLPRDPSIWSKEDIEDLNDELKVRFAEISVLTDCVRS